MDIRTEFNIGDEVYCIRSTYVLPYKIRSIEVQVSQNNSTQEYYGLQPLLPNAEDSQITHKVLPRFLFRTKAQAIEKIFYVLEHPDNRRALRGTKFIKEE